MTDSGRFFRGKSPAAERFYPTLSDLTRLICKIQDIQWRLKAVNIKISNVVKLNNTHEDTKREALGIHRDTNSQK